MEPTQHSGRESPRGASAGSFPKSRSRHETPLPGLAPSRARTENAASRMDGCKRASDTPVSSTGVSDAMPVCASPPAKRSKDAKASQQSPVKLPGESEFVPSRLALANVVVHDQDGQLVGGFFQDRNRLDLRLMMVVVVAWGLRLDFPYQAFVPSQKRSDDNSALWPIRWRSLAQSTPSCSRKPPLLRGRGPRHASRPLRYRGQQKSPLNSFLLHILADRIGLRGRAPAHYPMLKNSDSASITVQKTTGGIDGKFLRVRRTDWLAACDPLHALP
jgi:hypothetical protein